MVMGRQAINTLFRQGEVRSRLLPRRIGAWFVAILHALLRTPTQSLWHFLTFRYLDVSFFPCSTQAVNVNNNTRKTYFAVAHRPGRAALDLCDTQPISPGWLKHEPALRQSLSDTMRIDAGWALQKGKLHGAKPLAPLTPPLTVPHHSRSAIYSLMKRYHRDDPTI